MTKQIIAFDTETRKFETGCKAPEIACLTWATGEQSGIVIGKDNIFNWLSPVLDASIAGEVLLVGHNVGFDAMVAMENFRSLWGKIWQAFRSNAIVCTEVREKLIDIAKGRFKINRGKPPKKGYSLAACVYRNCDGRILEKEDTWRLRYGELIGVPIEKWPQEAIDYAIGDAVAALALYNAQEERAAGINYTMPTQYMDTRTNLSFNLTGAWGIITEKERVEKVDKKILIRTHELVHELVPLNLLNWGKKGIMLDPKFPPDVAKSTKLVRTLVEKYYPGTPPRTDSSKTFPNGQIRTNLETIEQCNYPPLVLLTEFESLRKNSSTYVQTLKQLLIHAYFNAIGTETDRTSCSGPNLQNQPKFAGIRECFIPREGYCFLAVDYDSQEMRTLAQALFDLLGYSSLAYKYQQNRKYDPHLDFASKMLGISIEEATQRLKAEDPAMKTARQNAKVSNFGFPGGMAAKTLVKFAKGWSVIIEPQTAISLRAGWLQQMPEMSEFFAHNQAISDDSGPKIQVNPRSGFRRGGVNYCPACNGNFQTPAAHITKEAMFECCDKAYNDRNSALYGSRPVALIHDELIFEVPIFAGHWAAQEMIRIMVEVMERWTPNVPSSAEATLMDRWSKKAKPTFKDGLLVPWTEAA